MELTIRTNNQERDILYRWELSESESKEFDYLPANEGSFFRYKGEVYDLGEFLRIPDKSGWACDMPDSFFNWDGYQSDSFFSGILVRYADDFEKVIVGWYCS